MDPPSLYSLTFKIAYRQIWQDSSLPKLLVDIINKKYGRATFTSEQYHRKVTENLRKIKEKLWSYDHFPFRLKVIIMAAVSGMNYDMIQYIEELASGLEKPVKKNIRYCMANIVWTSNNVIDMRHTILTIMQKSSLDIVFDISFLGRHCISQKDVSDAMKKATTINFDTKRPVRAAVSKFKHVSVNNATKIQALIKRVMQVTYYWDMERRMNDRYYDGSMLQYVTKSCQWTHALEYYYNLAKEEYDEERFYASDSSSNDSDDSYEYFQKVLLELAEWAIDEKYCCQEKVLFFKKHLAPQNWEKLLRKYFDKIVIILLASWNHRQFCVQLCTDNRKNMDMVMLQSIFKKIAELCKELEFEYYDIISVVQLMWEIIPDALKDDHDISFVLIPKIVLSQADFESLVHFTKQYNIDRQKQVLGLIIFKMYATSREHLVATCLKTVRQLGLDITNHRDLLDRELFKKFLLIEARSETNNYDQIWSLAQTLCDTAEQISALKQDIFRGDCFSVELLSGLSHKKDFCKLFDWEDKQLELFKERLIKKELIHDIYDQRLIENSTIEDADSIFRWLKFTPDEVKSVKIRVKDNKTVVHMVLLNMIETDHKCFEANKEWLLGAEATTIMRKFVYSEEAVTAICKMLKNTENYKKLWTVIEFYNSDDIDVLDATQFVSTWLLPYVLIDQYKQNIKKFTNAYWLIKAVNQTILSGKMDK